MGTGHVEKHLVDRKGLHRRRIGRADLLKRPGTPLVQRKITRYAHEIRTFPQRQSTGSPVVTPYFFAGIDFATTMLRLSFGSPPIQDGSPEDPAAPPLRASPPPRRGRRCSHPHEISTVPYCFPHTRTSRLPSPHSVRHCKGNLSISCPRSSCRTACSHAFFSHDPEKRTCKYNSLYDRRGRKRPPDPSSPMIPLRTMASGILALVSTILITLQSLVLPSPDSAPIVVSSTHINASLNPMITR